MRSRRRVRVAGLVLLGLLSLCIVACFVAYVYQDACRFEMAESTVRARPGEEVRLRLWQWDCLIGIFAHACYNVPQVSVQGLPPGATVQGVEWLDCHESDLILSIDAATAPGSYRLRVKGPTVLVPAERVVLEIVAP